jgi:hypothetical protein
MLPQLVLLLLLHLASSAADAADAEEVCDTDTVSDPVVVGEFSTYSSRAVGPCSSSVDDVLTATCGGNEIKCSETVTSDGPSRVERSCICTEECEVTCFGDCDPDSDDTDNDY